jgi:hypothetical protein
MRTFRELPTDPEEQDEEVFQHERRNMFNIKPEGRDGE